MMNAFVVCIGSNVVNSQAMISHAVASLAWAGCEMLSHSDFYQVSSPYVNYVAKMQTAIDFESLHALTKAIERDMGRNPGLKSLGIVPIDIDIVIFNDQVVRPADFQAPYFQQGYKSL